MMVTYVSAAAAACSRAVTTSSVVVLVNVVPFACRGAAGRSDRHPVDAVITAHATAMASNRARTLAVFVRIDRPLMDSFRLGVHPRDVDPSDGGEEQPRR